MQFFKNIGEKPKSALKVAGIIVLGVILLAFVSKLARSTPRPMFSMDEYGVTSSLGASFGTGKAMMRGGALSQSAQAPADLSVRNVAPGYGAGSIGADAEAFEVTEYGASIETGDLKETCGKVASLKSKSYVVFENSNAYRQGCGFTFKVKKANVSEILAFIKALDPRDFSENTRTIQKEVSDYTSEEEILKKKLGSIDDTLKSALSAYGEITAIATRSGDASSLAKIIDSKIGIIERLTQERINVNAQLDYLGRSKAEALDRLEYTRFNVNVYENKYVDGTSLKDSWKEALREFVFNVNDVIQALTIGLLALVLVAVQYILYVIIAIAIVKYLWAFLKKFWRS